MPCQLQRVTSGRKKEDKRVGWGWGAGGGEGEGDAVFVMASSLLINMYMNRTVYEEVGCNNI